MKVSGRFVDKSIFVVIYTAVALLVVMGAHRLTDYTLDLAFYQDYLVPWEVSLMAWRQIQIEWKTDDGHDPVAYMQDLVLRMQAKGLQPPQSNTARAYVYRLNRFGAHARQILLVYKDSRIILYGLPSRKMRAGSIEGIPLCKITMCNGSEWTFTINRCFQL